MLLLSVSLGFANGYYSGDAMKLLEDIQVLKPTIFPTVPRILNRAFSKIMDSVKHSPPLKKWLFNKAVAAKTHRLLTTCDFKHPTYDKLVFKKVRQIFGGNLQLIITASAPISEEVMNFFKIALGIHIFEAYGQTETSGPVTLTWPWDPTSGHVGSIYPSMKVRLRDVPDMGYFSTDNPPRGEL